jgi:hypothetical protein
LHFLQSQTLGWVVIKILFGFKGVPSNPTSFALAEVVGLFTIAKVSHNSGNRRAVMLVTGRCLEGQHLALSSQHSVARGRSTESKGQNLLAWQVELSNSGCSFRMCPNQNWISRTMGDRKMLGE